MFRLCSILLLLALAAPVAALEGTVRVIDADTIDVGPTRVRLFGIDAPELGQGCQLASGVALDCGVWARDGVAALYHGRYAICEFIELDRYGRAVASCVVDGEDMGARIVADGLAFAFRRYSMDYDLAEKQAAVAGVGLHAMAVQSPAAYRQSGNTPPGDCVIKGNISSSGRIYHVPGQENYARTRIDEGRGERWFCSEDQARAAGWRPARR